MWFLIIVLLIYVGYIWFQKIEFQKLRNSSEQLKAIVVEYRKVKVPMRNNFSKMLYPYIQFKGGDKRLFQLSYANNLSKPFKIGDEISVFWHGGKLMYWHTYDSGLAGILPTNLKF